MSLDMYLQRLKEYIKQVKESGFILGVEHFVSHYIVQFGIEVRVIQVVLIHQ